MTKILKLRVDLATKFIWTFFRYKWKLKLLLQTYTYMKTAKNQSQSYVVQVEWPILKLFREHLEPSQPFWRHIRLYGIKPNHDISDVAVLHFDHRKHCVIGNPWGTAARHCNTQYQHIGPVSKINSHWESICGIQYTEVRDLRQPMASTHITQ